MNVPKSILKIFGDIKLNILTVSSSFKELESGLIPN